jgi:hypothetical protein
VGALVAVAIALVAFAIFVPVVQSSSLLGARSDPNCTSAELCTSLILINAYHYNSVSMLVFGFGASSAGIFGSGFYYSINS